MGSGSFAACNLPTTRFIAGRFCKKNRQASILIFIVSQVNPSTNYLLPFSLLSSPARLNWSPFHINSSIMLSHSLPPRRPGTTPSEAFDDNDVLKELLQLEQRLDLYRYL